MNQNDAKTVLRVVKIVVTVLVILIFGFNCYYTIGEQEQAVITTFGKAEAVSTPGLHFKIPFIQHVNKVDTTIKGLSIGYDVNTGRSIEEESLMITSDYNFVNVDFFLEYRVSDPIKALYASQNPVLILKKHRYMCLGV